MPVTELRDLDFSRRLSEFERAFVDYHSGEHADCIIMKSIFFRLSRDYPHVTFILVDAVNAPIATQTVFLEPMPYFAAFEGGKKIEGVSTREERVLRALLDRCFRAGEGSRQVM